MLDVRKSITRTITYSVVVVSFKDEVQEFTVYGETTPSKEMKKLLKAGHEELPNITVDVITEKRAISLEKFLENSIIINESEEN